MVQSVLIRKSTKEIIKHALYPKAEITPFLEGEIDPDYEWLIENIPFAEPDYDPRIYIMVTNLPDLNFLESFQEHPLYAGIRECRVTYTPEKRQKEDIIMSIENTEKEKNNSIFSEAAYKDLSIQMMASINKASTGAQLTAEEQSQIDKLTTINLKISKNLANKILLVSQVNNDQEPNIDLGWESV